MRELNERFSLELRKNEEDRGVDLVSDNLRVEVKFDRMMEKTGNVFIEYAYKWKASWILKYEDLDIFVYGSTERMMICDAKYLQEKVSEWIVGTEFRKIKGWDGWQSSWLLIPLEDFRPHIKREIIFE